MSIVGTLPKGFYHGYSTAAAQIEGAVDRDGRGPSIFDHFCSKGLVDRKETSAEGIRSYDMYKEDVAVLKSYGSNCYRFSISWSRVIPLGGRNDPINEKGLKYYSDLIDECLANGITPFVTIHHFDLPLALEQRYGGWLNEKEIVQDFVSYAKLLFTRFGDRVKHWITINEPHIMSLIATTGFIENWVYERDGYIHGHNLVLGHAMVVDLYRREFKPTQGGLIGITLSGDWGEPIDGSEKVKYMTDKRMEYVFGQFADPIYLGKLPPIMSKELGDRLPDFTPEQWALVKGSSDFFGLNTYSCSYVTGHAIPEQARGTPAECFGMVGTTTTGPDGKLIGRKGEVFFLYDVPWGFKKLLLYIQKTWAGPSGVPITITENGWCSLDEADWPKEKVVADSDRQDYYTGHLNALVEAVKEGANVNGYFGWSLADSERLPLPNILCQSVRTDAIVVFRRNSISSGHRDTVLASV